MTNLYDRNDASRRLLRLLKRQVVMIGRATTPKRRPRPKPMTGDLPLRIKRLETALHIRKKRKKPVTRKHRRLSNTRNWTVADLEKIGGVSRPARDR